MTFNSFQRENSLDQKYLYNGKELQAELDLGWLDYGARMYMPDAARFTSIDPQVEQYNWQSPYAYAANDSIKFIDVNGEGPGKPNVVPVVLDYDLKSRQIAAEFFQRTYPMRADPIQMQGARERVTKWDQLGQINSSASSDGAPASMAVTSYVIQIPFDIAKAEAKHDLNVLSAKNRLAREEEDQATARTDFAFAVVQDVNTRMLNGVSECSCIGQ